MSPVADVEQLLRGVPELVKSEHSKQATELKSALKKARQAFQNDESGSSSSEKDEAEDVRRIDKSRDTRRWGKEQKGNGVEGSVAKHEGSPHAKLREIKTGNELAHDRLEGDKFVTPAKPPLSSGKRVKLSGKKERMLERSARRSGPKSKTASTLKRDIEALKKDDPDFYKFLEENDATLLDFDLEDDLIGFSDEEMKVTEEDELEEKNVSNGQEQEAVVAQTGKDGSKLKEIVHVKDTSVANKENDNGGDEQESNEPEKPDPDRQEDRFENATPIEKEGENVDPEVKSIEREEAVSGDHGTESKSTNAMTGEEDHVSAEPNSDEEDDNSEEERELMEEREAAAEAGLDLYGDDTEAGSEEDGEPLGDERPHLTEEEKKTVVVNTAYLRDIKEKLGNNRTCLKATKDLLRLFRAGRDILPSQTKGNAKAKRSRSKASERDKDDKKFGKDAVDVEEDEFADDGSTSSGKVKFVTSTSYQHAMNLAIIGIQDALDRMLGKPESKKGFSEVPLDKWDPAESSRWLNLQPIFRPYVFHMLALCDGMNDPHTLRFLLKRLEKLLPYTRDNKLLLKKIIRVAGRVWSSDSVHMSGATKLRAYLLLSKLAHFPGNAETVLRSCCTIFSSQIANICNPRTLQRTQFAVTCMVELFGVDMGASYTTAFTNLREMAVSLRVVLVAKDEKGEVERIHNWSYINQLRLWSQVLSKYGGQDELQPLIYPYVQISLGVIRVHATPRTFPMRLHVASYLSDLVAATGIFIPVAPHLLQLLRCNELRKKPEHSKTKALEWRSLLRVPDDLVKTKTFLSGVVNGVVFQLSKFFSTISRHVSFPELSHVVQCTLRKFSKEISIPEWKTKVLTLVEKLQQTADVIAEARARADFSPHGAVSPEGMLGVVPGLDRDKKTPIQLFYEVERARVLKEEHLRDENDKSREINFEKGKNNSKKTGHAESDSEVRNTEDATNASDQDDSDSDAKAITKQGKRKNRRAENKRLRQKQVPSLSVPKGTDDEDEDVVEDLVLDSEESSDE